MEKIGFNKEESEKLNRLISERRLMLSTIKLSSEEFGRNSLSTKERTKED